MNTNEVIILARKHLGSGDMVSARLRLSAAIQLHEEEHYTRARASALRSIAYSVGHFHEDYRRASL